MKLGYEITHNISLVVDAGGLNIKEDFLMKRRTFIYLILLIATLTILAGCKKTVEEKVSEKITEKMLESATDDAADIDIDDEITTIKTEQGSTQVGSNIQWPKDKMGNLKELKANITMVSEDRENVITYIMFEGLEKAGAEKYLESIKELGYKPIYEVSSGDGFTFIGNNENGFEVNFSFSNDGIGNISVAESTLTKVDNINVDSSEDSLFTGDDIISEQPSSTTEEIDMTDDVPWPGDFFEATPELEGKITGINRSSNEVGLFIEYVEKDVATDYIEKIKEAGFIVDPTEALSSDYIHYEAYNSKEDYIIILWNNDNTSSLTLVKSD